MLITAPWERVQENAIASASPVWNATFETHTTKDSISSNIADMFSVQNLKGLTVQFCPS